MASSNKTWNDERKKKMVIKTGAGGIGAVILLGGALATAALASALAVRAGRKDRGRNSPPEKKKLSGEDEAKEREEIVVSDDQTSEGVKKEVELDNGTEGFLVCTRSSILDEEGKIEINGGAPGDFEASDEILRSKNLEKDDGFVVVGEDSPSFEEKWPLESQNKMPEDEENTNVDKVYNEEEQGEEKEKNDHDDGEIEVISCKDGTEGAETQRKQEENDGEVVQIDENEGGARESMEVNMEKNEMEVSSSVDGEISGEKKCVEATERAKVDLGEDGINQEGKNNVDDTEEKEEQEDEASVPELESVVEHENLDGDERGTALSSETVDVVQEDETIEERVENVEEKLVEEEDVVPELESVVEHENVDGDERESALSSETVEVVQEDETTEERVENVEKLVEDEAVVQEFESVVEYENVDGCERGSALSSETVDVVEEDETIEVRLENVDEKLVEDEAVVQELESVVEHENVDGDERESVISSETVGVVQENETIEERLENVEEKAVEDEAVVPELESVVEHENLDGGKREIALPSETMETVQEDETIEERLENVEEKLVEHKEKCDEGIVPEKCEEVESMDGAKQSDKLSNLIEKKHEKVLQMIDSEATKELIISPNHVEIAKNDEEVPESLELNESDAITQFPVSQEDEVEEKMIHHEFNEAVKNDIIDDESTDETEHKSTDEDEEEEDEEDSVITTESSDDGAIKDDIVEESSVETSDSSTESNLEAVWPAESAKAKLVSYEFEGKVLEDNQTNYQTGSAKFSTSEKTFTNKYMAKRRMAIGMLSLLLSLSCSWFFDLSFVKLCVVLFLTMAVSEIHGY